MVQPQLRLGFISIARTTFDIPLAEEVTARARAHLEQAGFALAGPDTLVTTVEEVEAALKPLVANKPDLMVVFQATFADSTMVMRIARPINTPLVLWAIPEESTGERLRLNSLCGINLAGHALTRSHQHFESLYAPTDDPSVPERLRTLASAGRVRRMLRHTYVGQVGKPPDGFETCIPHPALLKARFGIKVVPLELEQVFADARATDPAQVNALRDTLGQKIDGLDTVDQSALNGTLASYTALRDMARRERLTAFAVRCWPQFFTEMGCAACGALSLLNEERMPAACETDVNGAITQLILQWISGDVAFDADLVSFDREKDTAVLWHCGKAPLSMADPEATPRATVHSNRQKPLLMEFPLKPGTVTLARLSEATGEFRLVIGRGEMQRAPISFSGTSGVIRFERPVGDVLDMLLSEGLEHHVALTYGDHVDVLLALARLLDLPLLRL